MRDKTAFGCVNNTIRTRSGRYFDLANPKPEQFTFADISGALSKLCRFGGHLIGMYSVAEHSVHCAAIAQADGLAEAAQRAVLLHDAAEAFTGDIVKPLKIMLSEFPAIERRIEACIAAKFGVDFDAWADVVREIDRAMLIAERRILFPADGVTWTGEESVRRLSVELHRWPHWTAEYMFIGAAATLGIDVAT